jgi:hypothetical protein
MEYKRIIFQKEAITKYYMILSNETILFELSFISDYWKDPPGLEIYIDNVQKFQGLVVDQSTVIKFAHELAFGDHILQMRRTGKTNNQTRKNEDGEVESQDLKIDYIKIDGVNIRNMIWTNSYYVPEYPEPWASQQRALGIEIESQVPGETWFGHNGVWNLKFTSPFYRFLMDWMG